MKRAKQVRMCEVGDESGGEVGEVGEVGGD